MGSELEAALDALDEYHKKGGKTLDQVWAECAAKWSKPVAWAARGFGVTQVKETAERWRLDGHDVEPLVLATTLSDQEEQIERLRRALAWIDNADPELVAAAEEKFGFKLFPPLEGSKR